MRRRRTVDKTLKYSVERQQQAAKDPATIESSTTTAHRQRQPTAANRRTQRASNRVRHDRLRRLSTSKPLGLEHHRMQLLGARYTVLVG